MINEEGLRDWFGKSKSKDGKSGWVNVVTGGTCASDKPGEGTPKCVSSAKRASMSKKERLSAQRRKKAADPGQQQKSGAAKPTYVKTDSPRKMKEETVNEATDKKGKGSGSKDACYHKVKSRYSVWPSAYASGALVKCRKVGAANWGNSSKKEEFEGFYDLPAFTESQIAAMKYAGIEVEVIDEACWKGYEKKGMKTMFGKRYPNCVKKEETEVKESHKNPESVKGIAKELDKAVEMHKSQAKRLRKAGVSEETVDEACWDSHEQRGMKKKGNRMVPNCVPKGSVKKEEVTGGILVQDAQDFKPREIESVDVIEAPRIKGGVTDGLGHNLEERVVTKMQSGNMYQVIFGWRGKMMMVKLFFPNAKPPTRQEVAAALDKMYPGSQLRSYSFSVVDYDDPYINVGEEVVLEEKKKGEKYCRLCEKRETRDKCAYGGKMWDKYSVDDVDDKERGDAASDSGITDGGDGGDGGGAMGESLDSGNYNKDVENRMKSDETKKRNQVSKKFRMSRYKQNKAIHEGEEYSNWRQAMQEDMSGMSQKSGDKRSTESGAGMTAKGVAKYNRRTGGNLKTAVTTPPSKLKPGSKAANRRKSFCARSRGWTGERGKAARRRWNC